jgi:hypothetical protein
MSPRILNEHEYSIAGLSGHTHDVDIGISFEHANIVSFAHALKGSDKSSKTRSNNQHIDSRGLV